MERSKFSKPVAFNKKNEKDRIMLQHVKRKNFSGYVKKLIWNDIPDKHKKMPCEEDRKQVPSLIQQDEQNITEKKKLSAAERIEQIKAQTKRQEPLKNSLPVFLPNKNINK
ncbi:MULTISPECIES: hypothetical protein [Bacillus cereus group]|uniref:hypothetical protein n=1 Tax=Bacillus cereus group TaxID=86661 RepID=UPI000BF481AB|nr:MULTISPECIES: hypothetical protein [Bacillus cereus group]PGA17862.1 hypothetical protein COL80_29205 [Bacillus thuringiensis]